jgi:hypothetical protein
MGKGDTGAHTFAFCFSSIERCCCLALAYRREPAIVVLSGESTTSSSVGLKVVADLDLAEEAFGVAPFLEKVGGTYLSGVGGALYFDLSLVAVVCFETTLGVLDFVTVGFLFVAGFVVPVLLSMDIAAAAADDVFPEVFGLTMRDLFRTLVVPLAGPEDGGGAGGSTGDVLVLGALGG